MCLPPRQAPQSAPAGGRIGPLALIRRALGNRRGASASEFAIIAGPFFLMVLGTIEASWQLMTGMALDHAALRASRFGMTGSNLPPAWLTQNQENVGVCRSANIRWLITRATNGLIKDNSDLVITTTNWSGVGGAGGGGGAAGAGGRGAIVSCTVSYRQPFITGAIANRLWGGSDFRHSAFLIVKNEPFDNEPC